MVYTMITLFVVVIFGLFMWFITAIINKLKPFRTKDDKPKEETKREKGKKGFLEKYCNDQKNDSRRQLAHFILIHEDNERKGRGQTD